MKKIDFRILMISMILKTVFLPVHVWACACGCNVFGVGTNSMFPDHPGGMAFVEYDVQNQNKNWSGKTYNPADYNNDKQIITNFITVGYQKMINRNWGYMAEIPYWNRDRINLDANGNPAEVNHSAIADIRLRGIYTGFSPDMSTGLTFGLKLPSGDYTSPSFDPDTEIGTGSTALFLGGFHRDQFPWTHDWTWFLNMNADLTVLNADGYRPGSQIDFSMGSYYGGWNFGSAKLAPVAQVVGSYRDIDTGTFAADSGFSRLILAPGFEIDTARLIIFSDIGFPVYQYIKGNQLVASQLIKLNIGYKF